MFVGGKIVSKEAENNTYEKKKEAVKQSKTPPLKNDFKLVPLPMDEIKELRAEMRLI